MNRLRTILLTISHLVAPRNRPGAATTFYDPANQAAEAQSATYELVRTSTVRRKGCGHPPWDGGAAGVSKVALFGQGNLLGVVRENIVARISESADEVMRFDGSSGDLLSHLVTSWWREYGDSTAGGLGKLVMAESGNFPEIARFFVEEVIEPWHGVLAAAVGRGIERGEFRRVEPQMFVRVATAPLVMLSLWKRSFGPCSQTPIDADAYIATHVDMMLAALRPA
jgi:hypothetical protein